MTDFRTRNRLWLVELEGTPGTAETPTVSANAIKAEGLVPNAPFEFDRTAEHTASLDNAAGIVGGGMASHAGTVLMKGSGTGGTAPDWDPLAQASGLAVTTLASDESDTAQTGASGSITLAAGESSSDDAYNGMVITTTGGTGSGQRRVITDYVGSTKVASVYPDWSVTPDNTTTYTVHACNVYVPASASLGAVTSWIYDLPATGSNARVRKGHGMVGNLGLTIPANRAGRMAVQLTGVYTEDPSDVSAPGDPTYDSGVAAPFINADVYLGGAVAKFNQFALDLGNAITVAPDPTATHGHDLGIIGARNITGRINPRQVAAATRNVMADFVAGTQRALWLRWGSTAGHRLSLYMPAIKYTGGDPEDLDGLIAEGAPFEAVGQDTGLYLSVY